MGQPCVPTVTAKNTTTTALLFWSSWQSLLPTVARATTEQGICEPNMMIWEAALSWCLTEHDGRSAENIFFTSTSSHEVICCVAWIVMKLNGTGYINIPTAQEKYTCVKLAKHLSHNISHMCTIQYTPAQKRCQYPCWESDAHSYCSIHITPSIQSSTSQYSI